MTEQQIRILVVDDHPIVRDGLVAILSTQPDFTLIGAAADGREAVTLAATDHPDVILLDLEMPVLDGVQTLQALRASDPTVKVLVFTVFDTDDRILAAVRAGAQGYLLKGAPREEIFGAIRVIHAGGSLLTPLVASKLLHRVNQPTTFALTPRELDVLRLLARGLPNKEIATSLVISERTVKFHVTALLHKLGASNRTEAVTIAAQQGVIQLSR